LVHPQDEAQERIDLESMSEKKKVVVAMSGGVDSSVAAALLVSQGYEVIGMMLRLWSEPNAEAHNRCCTPDAMAMARRISAKLGIPFYAIDAREIFYQTVVTYFNDGYAQGTTPNPCLVCNRHIRWEFLLNHALALGADAMATGHYARTLRDPRGRFRLLRAVDRHKDQSYVLHVLGQQQLAHAIFPLGDYTKPQVRQLARDFGLPGAERSESQDLCFLGKGDYRSFLQRNSPHTIHPGPIINSSGDILGKHQGLAFYTIGQRKGLGLAGPQPMYVLDKDLSRNALIVGERHELGRTELVAAQVNWIAGEPPQVPRKVDVKIRYKAAESPAMLTLLDAGRALLRFAEPLRDITPGQAAVFYEGDICLGGGLIQPAAGGGYSASRLNLEPESHQVSSDHV
jgi:tRNA-uridine 2-sulfurtransferase